MKRPPQQRLLFGEVRKADVMPRKPPRLRQWNTVEAVAAYFDVSVDTVKRWIEAGEMVALKKGQVLRVAKQSIRMFIHRNKTDRPDRDEKAARRAAVAICEAKIKDHLRDLIPEPRARHTRACAIWAALAPVIREHAGDI